MTGQEARDDERLAQALFRTLYDAGVSFESGKVIPLLMATVRSAGYGPTPAVEARDDERDALAKAMCAVENRSKAASLEEVQAGIQRWTRHRYEADRLIDELTDAGYEVRARKHPEPEWEYGVMSMQRVVRPAYNIAHARSMAVSDVRYQGWDVVRRAPVGPWVPVGEGEQ